MKNPENIKRYNEYKALRVTGKKLRKSPRTPDMHKARTASLDLKKKKKFETPSFPSKTKYTSFIANPLNEHRVSFDGKDHRRHSPDHSETTPTHYIPKHFNGYQSLGKQTWATNLSRSRRSGGTSFSNSQKIKKSVDFTKPKKPALKRAIKLFTRSKSKESRPNSTINSDTMNLIDAKRSLNFSQSNQNIHHNSSKRLFKMSQPGPLSELHNWNNNQMNGSQYQSYQLSESHHQDFGPSDTTHGSEEVNLLLTNSVGYDCPTCNLKLSTMGSGSINHHYGQQPVSGGGFGEQFELRERGLEPQAVVYEAPMDSLEERLEQRLQCYPATFVLTSRERRYYRDEIEKMALKLKERALNIDRINSVNTDLIQKIRLQKSRLIEQKELKMEQDAKIHQLSVRNNQ